MPSFQGGRPSGVNPAQGFFEKKKRKGEVAAPASSQRMVSLGDIKNKSKKPVVQESSDDDDDEGAEEEEIAVGGSDDSDLEEDGLEGLGDEDEGEEGVSGDDLSGSAMEDGEDGSLEEEDDGEEEESEDEEEEEKGAAAAAAAGSGSVSASDITVVENEGKLAGGEKEVETFAELGLCQVLCECLEGMGWKKPSIIQQQTLPTAFKGRDIIGLAETGSGKTGAFALPILQALLGE